jgi:ribosomal protein L40E
MKKISTLIIMSLMISMFAVLVHKDTATAAVFSWKDDFDYQTKQEMRDAGWRLDNEVMLSLGGGALTIDNDGSTSGPAYYLGHFPDNIFEFEVEDKVMWIGRSYGGPRVWVNTTSHYYIWAADAYYHKYDFVRDGIKVLNFGEYTPQLNVWQIFRLEKRGNTFYLYQDNELKNTFAEPDNVQASLTGVAAISHWSGTLKYDYISLEDLRSETPFWLQWWFWTNFALATTTGVFAFTTFYYRKRAFASEESKATSTKPLSKKDSKVCPNCGATLPLDSVFCGKCGTRQE